MRTALKALVALFLSVLLAELALRLFTEPPLLISFVASDPLLGHKGPASRTVITAGNKVHYNADGFRSLPAPDSAKGSVAFLGDSLVEGITIPDTKHFAYLFGIKTGYGPALLSAGDWGSAQELLAFRHARPADTKAVLLAFSSLTDFTNNGPAFAGRYQSKVDFLRPYLREEGGEAKAFYLRPGYLFLRLASRLFLHFDNARLSRALAEPVPSHPDCRQYANAVPLHVYFTDETSEWKEAFDGTALAFSALKKEADKAGISALAVYVPNDFELYDEKWERDVRRPQEACFPGRRMDRRETERKFLAAAKAAGLPAASLFDFFAAEVAAKRELFLPDGHLNEAGHAAFARALEELAREHRLLQ